MSRESLGLIRLESIIYYTQDLDRSRKFYVDQLDFAEVARSSEKLERDGGQRAAVFQAGDIRVVAQQPLTSKSRAARYLARHPAGIGTLVFEVKDVDVTFELLEKRGGTPISEIETFKDDHGYMRVFSVTTPLGSTTFRFVERHGFGSLCRGFEPIEHEGPTNRYGFESFDHVTSNFETMKPALLWMEHVLGFEPYWGIEFHTSDVDPNMLTGSGLRSQVMWDPESGIKFANNEPWRPFFTNSQINLFTEQHRGDGVQHVAFTTPKIQDAVRGLRDSGINFMHTPAAYYEALPQRIIDSGIGKIEEDISELQELGILVDGDRDESYLLQIFLNEAATHHNDKDAGPFFYEIIQRKGDKGFGGGNFRALFESIERAQVGGA